VAWKFSFFPSSFEFLSSHFVIATFVTATAERRDLARLSSERDVSRTPRRAPPVANETYSLRSFANDADRNRFVATKRCVAAAS
jgi:hypothetical protein